MLVHPHGFFAAAGVPVTVSQVIIEAVTVISAHNAWVEIWTDVSGSPGAQIGGDSDTVNVSTAGDKTFTWSGAEPEPLGDFWVILQVDGGDVNYQRHNSTPDSGVTGGDFATSGPITDLVSRTTFMMNAEVTFSDLSTAGQFATNIAFGMGVNFHAGTLIQYTP